MQQPAHRVSSLPTDDPVRLFLPIPTGEALDIGAEAIEYKPGDKIRMDSFRAGDILLISDYKGRRYRIVVGAVYPGKANWHDGLDRPRTIMQIQEITCESTPAITVDITIKIMLGDTFVFVASNENDTFQLNELGCVGVDRIEIGTLLPNGVALIPDNLTRGLRIRMTPSYLLVRRSGD